MNEEQEVVETNDEESGFEIEVVDDTPEEDRGRPRRSENAEPEIPSDEELENYSDKVQGRIKKLRFEYHEERRAKEEAERLREEAIIAAKKLHEENQRLKSLSSKSEEALVNQAKTRVAAQLEQAKGMYRQAYETGDTDAILSAQEKLTELQAQKIQYDRYKPKKAPEKQEFIVPQAPQQQFKPDAEAMDWADKNTWFGKNKKMTSFAMGVHDELVSEGIDPRSPDYYKRIDQEMRETFPHEFDEPVQNRGSVVAPASRSAKTSRKVRLTNTQIALAKRLGISNEMYAAQLMKEKQ